MQSGMTLDLENCSLGTALQVALQQIGLFPYVRDGMIYITNKMSSDQLPVEIDYYLLAGHCVLALLSAGLGALLVPLVSNREA